MSRSHETRLHLLLQRHIDVKFDGAVFGALQAFQAPPGIVLIGSPLCASPLPLVFGKARKRRLAAAVIVERRRSLIVQIGGLLVCGNLKPAFVCILNCRLSAWRERELLEVDRPFVHAAASAGPATRRMSIS